MSQNYNDPTNPSNGLAGTGATDAGTTRDTTTGSAGLQTTSGATAETAAPAHEGITAAAQEYGQKIADAASTAKDYVSDKVSVVGDKFKDLQNVDYKQVAEDAKTYARENPGQALLIAAAAGLVLGYLLRPPGDPTTPPPPPRKRR